MFSVHQVLRLLMIGVACVTAALVYLLVYQGERLESIAPLAEANAAAGVGSQGISAVKRPAGFQGSLSCSATACHGAAPGLESAVDREAMLIQAYSLWAEVDPHAGAYRTLHSRRSQRMVEQLTGAEHGTAAYHLALQSHCYGCHAPLASGEGERQAMLAAEGVSCEACHGSAEPWLLTHTGASFDPFAGGMRLTEPPASRAGVCVDCHVGTGRPGMQVTHDILAAGHPRLNFEFRAYHDALPKHWQPTEHDRNATSLWNEGQRIGWEAAYRQLRYRAEHASVWPEFAEMDCYACHRALTDDVGRSGPPREPLPRSEWYSLGLALDYPSSQQELLEEELENARQILMNRHVPEVDQFEILSRYPFEPKSDGSQSNSGFTIPDYQYAPLAAQLERFAQQAERRPNHWETHAIAWLLAATVYAEASRPEHAIAPAELAELARLLATARAALSPPAEFQSGETHEQLSAEAQRVSQQLPSSETTP